MAGDDRGEAIVLGLIDELGFDAVDAGGLDDSWRQQPGSPVYAADTTPTACARPWRGRPERTADWRATDESPGSYAAPA